MTSTLIGQRLREFPEGLVAMTVLCCVILVINFSDCAECGTTWRSSDSDLSNLKRCERDLADHYRPVAHGEYRVAYEKYRVTYEKYLVAYEKHCDSWRRSAESSRESGRCEVAFAVFLFAIFPTLANGRLASIGLSATPSGGWRYWCVAGLMLTIAVTALAVPATGLWWLLGGRASDIVNSDWSNDESLLSQFLRAPFAEEIIYRMGICSVVAAWVGPRSAIAASGILFGLAHLVCGGANPVNLVAGFVLAWAFLKSNTILVPIALHSLGNILGWYVVTQWVIPVCR
jgi:membrane protease YdiL (CAAX protease family)